MYDKCQGISWFSPETVIYLELPPSSHGHCILFCWELERAWWPPVAAFKTVQKQLLPVDWQSQKPRQGAALANPSVNKHMKQATLLWPMVFKQLVTAAHALVTKFKHCESDWLIFNSINPCGGWAWCPWSGGYTLCIRLWGSLLFFFGFQGLLANF